MRLLPVKTLLTERLWETSELLRKKILDSPRFRILLISTRKKSKTFYSLSVLILFSNARNKKKNSSTR